MQSHRPSVSGAEITGNQEPQSSLVRPKRQRLSPAVIDLTKQGISLVFAGCPADAEIRFSQAEALCGVAAK